MKTERVFLCEWLGDYTDGYNDIPWPMVHEWVGYDAVRWINSQDYSRVQLILEKDASRKTVVSQLLRKQRQHQHLK